MAADEEPAQAEAVLSAITAAAEKGEQAIYDLAVGFAQKFPTTGSPEALVKGQQYYLYVSKDVGVPITRCLFTYG